MDFGEFSEQYKEAIHEKLREYVPIREPIDHYNIARDYIDRPSKYKRSSLLLLTARMFGTKIEDAILPAAAMQLSEDWLLAQDDWEDDSELRRGKPTLHRAYGAIHAINATNTDQIAMWHMLKDYIVAGGVKRGARLFDKFCSIMDRIIEGQYLDNKFIHDTRSMKHGTDNLYIKIAEAKQSCYTVYGPMQLGAITGNASDEQLQGLKEIGHAAGIAFQMIDDILDMTAEEEKAGKKRYGDLYEGKLTMIMLHTYRNATPQEAEKIDTIYAKDRKKKTEADIKFLRDTVEKYDGLGQARKVAERYADMARIAINKCKDDLPNNEYRKMLLTVMESMYDLGQD